MKKICTISFAAVAALALVSCAKDVTPGQSVRNTEPATISVGFDDATKTYYEKGKIKFVSGDKTLTVFDTENVNTTFNATDDGKDVRTFAGNITSGSGIKFVLFPETTAATCEGDVVSGVTIPTAQVINNNGSFGQKANLAISNDATTLKNVCGYIKFTAPQDGSKTFLYKGASYKATRIKSVKISTATDGEYFTGKGDIDFSGETPAFTFTEGSKDVSSGLKSYTEDGTSTKRYCASDYYFCVAPGTYHGIKATITYEDDSIDFMETANTLVIKRSKYTDLGKLDPSVMTQKVLKGTFTATGSTSAEGNATGLNNTTPYKLTSANLSVKRVCTKAGGKYNVGDIVQPNPNTAKTEITIVNNDNTFVAWATYGLKKNSSNSVITSLGFNNYKAGWSYDSAVWTAGETDGYGWFKLPAIEGYKLVSIEGTFSGSLPAGKGNVEMKVCPSVDADGIGQSAIATFTGSGTSQKVDIEGAVAGTAYYICFGQGNNQMISGPFAFTYDKAE